MNSDQHAVEAEGRTREMRKLWRSWRTVHELCQDRGTLFPASSKFFVLAPNPMLAYQGYELAEDEIKIPFEAFVAQFSDHEGNAK